MRRPRFRTISTATLVLMTAAAPVIGATAAASAATVTSCCTVTVNGPAVAMNVATPGKTAARTFHGTIGERVSTVVTNLVINSGTGCATLTLLDPSHRMVDTSGQYCGFASIGLTNAPDVLTVAGTYTVRLQLDQTATGSAKLWVSAPVTAGTVTVNGPAVPMNVTRVGQGVQRTFHGTIGERVSTVITNLVISTGTGGSGCATLSLLDPGGSQIDSSGQYCGFTSIGIGPDVLPASGTYTVRLELDQTATGGGSLRVST